MAVKGRNNVRKSALNKKKTDLLFVFYIPSSHANTPGTMVSSGFRDQTLAVKNRKKRPKIIFKFKKKYCETPVKVEED